jgi:hypothetical protein
LIPWLILVLLTAVGVAGAALGIHQSPKQATLKQAVANTLAASNYTSVFTSVLTSATSGQTQYLVYQAPDRIGGYVDTGGRRFYVAVINRVEYQSTQVATSRSSANLTFLRSASNPARSYDPVQGYLPYVAKATGVKQSGAVSTFTITQQGQSAKFAVTVAGSYVSQMVITAPGAKVTLDISAVGSSPPVTLPAGAKVSAAPSGAAG